MAERVKKRDTEKFYASSRPFGTTVDTTRQRFTWLMSRESLLRLMLSFVLAVALWLYVTNKQDAPVIYDYPALLPVTYHGLNSNFVVNSSPTNVRLRIELSSGAPFFYGASFQPYVDVSRRGPGDYRLPVQIQKDPGIKVKEVIPATIPVRIETLKIAPVPVVAKIQHRAPGYSASISIQPNTVRVSGPASVVAQVRRAVVNLNLTTYNLNSAYAPLLVNSQGQPVRGAFSQNSPEPSQVQVTVQVRAPATSKTLPVVVPGLRGRPKPGYGVVALEVIPAQILAQGSADKLSRLNSIATTPISINRRGAGTINTTVALRLPKGVRSATSTVRVIAHLAPVDTSTSVNVGVTPEGVGPGLVATIKPANVVVTALGPTSSVRQVADNLHVTVGLSGFGVGTFYLPLRVSRPSKYHVEGFYPSMVTVTISGR
ncbi:MAG: hypothetical protein NVSMB22_14380 [Chloroflexota bacterium]